MPCDISWEIPGRVIQSQFSGVVVPKDLAKSRDWINHYIHTRPTDQTVHIIIDNIQVDEYAIGMLDVRKSIIVQDYMPGWVVVISPQNTVIRSVANFFMAMAQQMTRGRYRFVDSHQEAVEFLCEQDDSLTFPDEQTSPHFEKSE